VEAVEIYKGYPTSWQSVGRAFSPPEGCPAATVWVWMR